MSRSPADILLPRLKKVRRVGDGRWMACCPAHDDSSPSLSIRLADNGRLLVHCWAGCDTEAVLQAVGLTFEALFPDDPSRDRAAYMRAVHQKVKLEPIDPLALERRIIWIAKHEAELGREISAEDRARVELAMERVRAADG